MQYLTVEIVLAKRKTSLITVFPQLLETFECERFNWDKAWKKENMNQNNAFCPPLIGFSTQSSQYQIWKANMYSILTVIELGPPVSKSSTWISKFYDPTDSEHEFYERKIKNWLSIGFELESTWLVTYRHNHYTCSTHGIIEILKLLYTHIQSLGTIP